MVEFDIIYKNIKLRLYCDERVEKNIREHFNNHVIFSAPFGEPIYRLIIDDTFSVINGDYYRMIDKWFDNATLDTYIDNDNRICYVNNINAKNEKYEQLLIQYFVANFFNRMLELNGYLGFHSACVEKDKYGVLFIAERNNGKTICMLNLMSAGFNSVTNDVIALKKIEDSIVGYGIAQSVSIRLGPTFCAQEENQKYVDLAKKKGIDICNKEMIDGNNMHLSDSELAELNHVSQTIDTPISCIIRPCYDPYVTEATFDRMSVEQLRELLYSQYRSLVHETTDFLINVKLSGVDEAERYRLFDNFLSIPAYYCHQNEKTTKQFVKEIERIKKRK